MHPTVYLRQEEHETLNEGHRGPKKASRLLEPRISPYFHSHSSLILRSIFTAIRCWAQAGGSLRSPTSPLRLAALASRCGIVKKSKNVSEKKNYWRKIWSWKFLKKKKLKKKKIVKFFFFVEIFHMMSRLCMQNKTIIGQVVSVLQVRTPRLSLGFII